MLRNSLIGLGMMPFSYSISESILDEKRYYKTLSKEDKDTYEWKHVILKDRAFYSSIILTGGSLTTFGTSSLIWMVPGFILTAITVPTLYKKD